MQRDIHAARKAILERTAAALSGLKSRADDRKIGRARLALGIAALTPTYGVDATTR